MTIIFCIYSFPIQGNAAYSQTHLRPIYKQKLTEGMIWFSNYSHVFADCNCLAIP